MTREADIPVVLDPGYVLTRAQQRAMLARLEEAEMQDGEERRMVDEKGPDETVDEPANDGEQPADAELDDDGSTREPE